MRKPFKHGLLASLTVVVLVTAFSGCNGGGSGASDDDDDDAGTTTPTPEGTPSFAVHIVPILEASCGTANNACHTRVAYGANSADDCRGWVALENTQLGAVFYSGADQGNPTGCPDRSLFDRLTAPGLSDAWQCGPNVFNPGNPNPKVPYVVPGDSAGSYLYRKINGGPYCSDGGASDPMPQTGSLTPDTIEVIQRWIDGGALP